MGAGGRGCVAFGVRWEGERNPKKEKEKKNAGTMGVGEREQGGLGGQWEGRVSGLLG